MKISKHKDKDSRGTAAMEEKWVFVDTSGGGIAMPLSPDTTAADLKRQICNEHPICFPSIGVIKVNGLMVKRRSCYYHLPDSIRINDVFQGKKGTWFLHVDVTLLNHSDEPHQLESVSGKFGGNDYSGREVACSPKVEKHATCESKLSSENKTREREGEECWWFEGAPVNTQSHVSIKRRDKKRSKKRSASKKAVSVDGTKEMCVHVYEEARGISPQEQERPFHYDIEKGMDQGGLSTIETSSVCVSEVASVTGLITRYFPEYDDVQSSDNPSNGTTNDESRASGSYQCSLQKPTKSEINEQKSDVTRHNTSQCAHQTPSKKIHFPLPCEQRCTTFEGKLGRAEVGKRFVLVTDDIKNCGSKKKSSISMCQSEGRKLSSSFDKAAVFEFSSSVD